MAGSASKLNLFQQVGIELGGTLVHDLGAEQYLDPRSKHMKRVAEVVGVSEDDIKTNITALDEKTEFIHTASVKIGGRGTSDIVDADDLNADVAANSEKMTMLAQKAGAAHGSTITFSGDTDIDGDYNYSLLRADISDFAKPMMAGKLSEYMSEGFANHLAGTAKIELLPFKQNWRGEADFEAGIHSRTEFQSPPPGATIQYDSHGMAQADQILTVRLDVKTQDITVHDKFAMEATYGGPQHILEGQGFSKEFKISMNKYEETKDFLRKGLEEKGVDFDSMSAEQLQVVNQEISREAFLRAVEGDQAMLEQIMGEEGPDSLNLFQQKTASGPTSAEQSNSEHGDDRTKVEVEVDGGVKVKGELSVEFSNVVHVNSPERQKALEALYGDTSDMGIQAKGSAYIENAGAKASKDGKLDYGGEMEASAHMQSLEQRIMAARADTVMDKSNAFGMKGADGQPMTFDNLADSVAPAAKALQGDPPPATMGEALERIEQWRDENGTLDRNIDVHTREGVLANNGISKDAPFDASNPGHVKDALRLSTEQAMGKDYANLVSPSEYLQASLDSIPAQKPVPAQQKIDIPRQDNIAPAPQTASGIPMPPPPPPAALVAENGKSIAGGATPTHLAPVSEIDLRGTSFQAQAARTGATPDAGGQFEASRQNQASNQFSNTPTNPAAQQGAQQMGAKQAMTLG